MTGNKIFTKISKYFPRSVYYKAAAKKSSEHYLNQIIKFTGIIKHHQLYSTVLSKMIEYNHN